MKQREAKRKRRVARQRKTHVPDAADCLSMEPRTSNEQTDRAYVNSEPAKKIRVQLEGFYFVVERGADDLFNVKFVNTCGKTVDPIPLTINDLDQIAYQLEELRNTWDE
jgi:hypothetical protein